MNRLGFVYFIEAIGAGAVKIGWAKFPARRLIQHQISCPTELRLLCSAPGTLAHEGAIQKMFAGCCIRGEWYRPNHELWSLIESVAKNGALPTSLLPKAGAIGCGNNITELRQRLGTEGKPISQAELAKRLGVHQTTVTRWEKSPSMQKGPTLLFLQQLDAATPKPNLEHGKHKVAAE